VIVRIGVPADMAAREALTTGCTVMLRRRVIDVALPFPPELDHPVAPMRHDRWLTLIAAAVGGLKDGLKTLGYGAEAPILERADFEHLEAQGRLQTPP